MTIGKEFFSSLLVWLGGLFYLVYTYVVAAFDVRFNSLFLVYVALLGCSLYALIGGLVTTDMTGIKARFTEKAPVKAVSIYLAALAVLFYFMWLSEIVPALIVGEIPQSIRENGTPTNAVHVLDMAWVLPAFWITAVGLWRKQALGYTLAGALLTYAVPFDIGDSVNGSEYDARRSYRGNRTGNGFRSCICSQFRNALLVFEGPKVAAQPGAISFAR